MSGFYKVSIEDRENLTMLAAGYMNKAIPRATCGQIFYDYNTQREIDNIYFEKNYYENLTSFIAANRPNFMNSNAGSEWMKLFTVLNNQSYLDNIDFGILELYDMGTDPSDFQIEPDYDKFEKIISNAVRSSTLYEDIKRVYAGINIMYWGNKNYIGLTIKPNSVGEINIDLIPIFKLISIHKLEIEKFNIIKEKAFNLLRVNFKVSSVN